MALAAIHRKNRPTMLLYSIAAIAYGSMILSFFLLNAPRQRGVERMDAADASCGLGSLPPAMGNWPGDCCAFRRYSPCGDVDGCFAVRSYQRRDRITRCTTESMTGTSTRTPT